MGTPKPSCGAVRMGVMCSAAGQVQTTIDGRAHLRRHVRWNCHRATCPDCWTSWAKREGEAVQDRLLQAGALMKRRAPRHWSWSPPQDKWAGRFAACDTEDEWKLVLRKLRQRAVALMRRHGLEGGALVVHPWRCAQKRGKERYRRSERTISPHVHVLAWGRADPSKEIHVATGWVATNIDARRKVRQRSLSGTVGYLLDHVGLVDGIHQVTWWGAAGYNQVVVDERTTIRRPEECWCGQTCDEYPVYGDEVDWSLSVGTAMVVERRRWYRLRGVPPPS